jgi:hypothetical protein
VFNYNGTYYMTAHESPDAVNFKKHWWGVSADGKSWTWYPLFTYTGTSNVNIPGVTLQPRTIGGTLYFYGLTDVSTDAGYGLGAIRLRVNTSNVRGYDRVEMWTWDTGWALVTDSSSNPNGNFNFIPSKILDAALKPKLLPNDEVWVSLVGRTRDCSNCHAFSGTKTNTWEDRIAVRTLITTSDPTAPPSFGSEILLQSNVRCMPGRYDNSRSYPMPLVLGSPRLLYSSSNDQDYDTAYYCTNPPAQPFYGMYIVVTGF